MQAIHLSSPVLGHQRSMTLCGSRSLAPCLRRRVALVTLPSRPFVVLRAAAEDEDAELEKRLAKLRQSKGATPYGQTRGAPADSEPETKKKPEKVQYDFSDETVFYEGPPHRGDLAINLLLGTTLIWLPLTIAAMGRGFFVNYKFTDKRIQVKTTAPWKNEQLDAAYQEVKEVRSVARGTGAWGDMVVVLKNGDKIELRSLDRFRELQQYILKRRDELVPRTNELSQEELMGEKPKARKGFA